MFFRAISTELQAIGVNGSNLHGFPKFEPARSGELYTVSSVAPWHQIYAANRISRATLYLNPSFRRSKRASSPFT
jgi:hypothetical protein